MKKNNEKRNPLLIIYYIFREKLHVLLDFLEVLGNVFVGELVVLQ